MSDSKNNLPVILGVVVLLAVAGGALYYISGNMKKNEPAVSAQAPAGEGAALAGSAAVPASTETASGDSSSGEPPATPEEEAEVAKAVGAEFNGVEVKPGNPVVASVDGKDVTRVDVYRYIRMMPANIQQLPPSAIYPLALDQVINTRLVQNKAEQADLSNDPEVKEQLNLARQQIIRSIYVQREVDKQISDADVKKAYGEYVAKVPAVEEIQAAHILVDSEQKAKDIIKKLQDGADFAALAKENSNDPGNKDKGGELGWFAATDMVPEFSEAAFKISKGEISKAPVKTQFGWHVIKVEDKRERPKPGFDELKEALRTELRRTKLEAMLESWKSAAKIQKFDINGDPLGSAPQVAPAAGERSKGGAEKAPVAAE